MNKRDNDYGNKYNQWVDDLWSKTMDFLQRPLRAQEKVRTLQEDYQNGLLNCQWDMDMAKLMMECERISVRSTIWQTAGMSWLEKKVLVMTSDIYPVIYDEVAKKLGLRSGHSAFRLSIKALANFARNYMDKDQTDWYWE